VPDKLSVEEAMLADILNNPFPSTLPLEFNNAQESE
jgi:hypothetical protein